VEVILGLKEPQNKRQLRHFLGMVNYYRDMWQRRSHLLVPLMQLVSKSKPFNWTSVHKEAYEEVKWVISKETLLSFPNFNKPFHMCTDASNYQLGSIIMQDDKPLAFYSCKLNPAQKRYTTGEQELLSIVETLKEFCTLLYGQARVVVHTDHKNILYGNLVYNRITRWRLLLEEYCPEIVHVKGDDNVIADALLHMEANFKEDWLPESTDTPRNVCAYTLSNILYDENVSTVAFNAAITFATQKDMDTEMFPMSLELIAKEQKGNQQIQKLLETGS
jgi:RNase H-like domain found in reverse transcriptase